MTTRQKNKLTMYLVVEKILDDNTSAWNSTSGFVNLKNSFSSLIAQLLHASQLQQEITKGITTDKLNIRKALNCAQPLAAQLFVYATQSGNHELRKAVDFSYTKLFRLRQNALPLQCSNILRQLQTHLAAVSVFNITNTQLQQLSQAIDRYVNKQAAVRLAMAQRAAITKQLLVLFKQTDKLLNFQLDNLVVILKNQHPGFYNAYNSARHIIRLGENRDRTLLLSE